MQSWGEWATKIHGERDRIVAKRGRINELLEANKSGLLFLIFFHIHMHPTDYLHATLLII